ncbi:hypothetical protein [Gimesia aquarii]|uniref:Uncharacterized protein n=1 Tax=Gimesia aquarii TaxID=2527964 RepID=A0A517VRB3_9PLAN|nr:hypothetical protein [Gimesia aquarii]QDT95558.1 hypothetical protein V144x_10030 [Gimesia aquarii]
MEDQQKPKPTKQVRIRAGYHATIEIVEHDHVIHTEHKIGPINSFDRLGFEEAFDFLEIERQAQQAELDEDFEQEQKLKQESEKTMLQTAFSYLTSFRN